MSPAARARPPLPDGPWLAVGLARSGLAAGRALVARGEKVVGVDSGSPRVDEPGFDVALQTDGLAQLQHARAVVKSPGVPREAAVIAAALAAGIPVLGELELAWRLLGGHDFVAVTGTNGKTTTVELLGAIHREAGIPCAVVGNVGTAASSLVGEPIAADAVLICEASSFQLEDTLAFAPEAAALLNLDADHLDRHGTLEAYRAAKLEVFARQGNDDIAVAPVGLGIDDLGGCGRRVCFGAGGELDVRADALWWDGELLVRTDEIRLRGSHNVANAAAGAALALARGVEADAVAAALRTFGGVAHRLEEVAQHDGVLYVNDSKASNVASALVALRAFEPGTIHAILGGRGKGQDFGPLREVVGQACKGAYLIGEDADAIASALHGLELPVTHSGTLEAALATASAAAAPGDVVLLSPACASWDQFTDFEQRGARFRELAQD